MLRTCLLGTMFALTPLYQEPACLPQCPSANVPAALCALTRAWLELQTDAKLLQDCQGADVDMHGQAQAQSFFLGAAGDEADACEVSTYMCDLTSPCVT